MQPTLLIGHFALLTYPIFLLIAFWVGVWIAAKRATQLGLDGDHIYNASLYGLIAGILGARLWFVLSHWDNYASDLSQGFSLSASALSVPEGIIVAVVVMLIYLQRNKVSLGLFADAVAWGLAVAIAIGNVGAFLGGRALGAPSDVPWAIEIVNTARHPIQLYEATAAVAIAGILFVTRNHRLWPGFQFWLFVALYGTSRLMLEIFRARPTLIGNGYLASQMLALLAIVVALAVMAYNFRNLNIHPKSI